MGGILQGVTFINDRRYNNYNISILVINPDRKLELNRREMDTEQPKIKVSKEYQDYLNHPEKYLSKLPEFAKTLESEDDINTVLVNAINLASYLRQEKAIKTKGQFMGDPKTTIEIADSIGVYREEITKLRRVLWSLGIKTAWKGGKNGGHFLTDDWKDIASDTMRAYNTARSWSRAARNNYSAFTRGGGTADDIRGYLVEKGKDDLTDELLKDMGGLNVD